MELSAAGALGKASLGVWAPRQARALGMSDLLVGAVVMRAEEVLLVRQSPGHPLEGQWTIPWGRVEPGESPASAALREVQEEGGVTATVFAGTVSTRVDPT